MILAAILRNFKCYKGINIIPFCGEDVQDMNIIIGNNGVGKTTKIICLIDTDALCPPIGMPSRDDNSVLLIRRLQEGDNGDINLIKIEDPTHRETEVEEILDPNKFYDALSATIDKYGDNETKAAMAAFSFDDTARTSRIKGDGGILKQNTLERNANEDKQRIIDFVDNHKDKIANEYVSKPYDGTELSWVTKLKTIMGIANPQ